MKTVRQMWTDIVDGLCEQGMSRVDASKKAVRENRELHQMMLDEAAAARAPKTPMFRVSAMAAEVEWRDLVDEFIAKGHTRQRATILANRKRPKLRAKAIASYNARQAAGE